MQWIVSQIGARQHYATPRAFQLRDELRSFYTEAWSGRTRKLFQNGPGHFKALAQRYSPDLPPEKVHACTLTSLWQRSTFKYTGRGSTLVTQHDEWRREGERFAEWVNRRLKNQPLDPSADVFYGCKSACLETLQMLRARGVFTLVDQADPAAVEEDLVQIEREKWPRWEKYSGSVPQSYYDRCAAEWDLADLILVYSDWTKEAIIVQGAPREKVIVVPLAYESTPSPFAEIAPKPPGDRLTVLWLGNVILRKGIQYLVEAARQLKDLPIDFVIAGEVMISEEAVATAPPNMKFIGRIFRGDVARIYQSADLFVLPTISDSFAITQVEAMSHGLPVIATPRCGAVVTEGIDGKIVPPANADALAAAIAQLAEDRALLESMSAAARKKAKTFTLASYGQQVHDEVARRRPDLK